MGAAKKARRAPRRKQSAESVRSDHVGIRENGKSREAAFPGLSGASINGAGILLLRYWRGILCLTLLVAISYFPALDAEFIWDDKIFLDEPLIQQWSGIWSIWLSPRDLLEAHYWPVVYSSFWLEHKLWGFEPAGYHAVNVFLHLANSLLVWVLMMRLNVTGAWAVAAVFAVHPLHVDSVAWIIERKDLLSALFYIAAVLAWIRFVDARRPSLYCGALALFSLALLSKSIAVTLPAALLIWHAWRRGRLDHADWLRLVPFFAVAILIAAADLSFYQGREPLDLGYSLTERALIASRALFFYAWMLLWPTELAVIYPHWPVDVSDPVSWAFLIGAVAVPAALWALRRRIGTGPLVGAAYFAVTLAPVLGFVDYGFMQFSFVADRYQYLAGLGVLAVLVSAIVHAAGKLEGRSRMAVYAGGVMVLAVLTVKTWSQAEVYRDETTFFRHIIALNPNARDAYLNLADALVEEGRFDDSLAAARIAIEQRPDHANAHHVLGRALAGLKRFEEAEDAFSKARELDPRDGSIAYNAGQMLREAGRHEDAVEKFREALAIRPDLALANGAMGVALNALGRYEEALEATTAAMSEWPHLVQSVDLQEAAGYAAWKLNDLEKAAHHFQIGLEADPNDVEIHLNLGRVRLEQHRFEEGREHLRGALDLRPEDSTTLLEVADALRISGYAEQSLPFYRQVPEKSPASAQALAGIGLALFDMNRYTESIEASEAAIALDPELPLRGEVYRFLGSAHAELGNLEEAVENLRRAIESDPDDADAIDRLGLLYFEHGHFRDALDQYLVLEKLRPDIAQTHINIGSSLVKLGRDEEALPVFERAQQLDPDYDGLRTTLQILRSAVGTE